MADEENKEEAKAGKKEEDEDQGETCCYKYGQCIIMVVTKTFFTIKAIFMFIANLIGLCWYPFKERTNDCCDCCGKRMNPHTDPAYGGF